MLYNGTLTCKASSNNIIDKAFTIPSQGQVDEYYESLRLRAWTSIIIAFTAYHRTAEGRLYNKDISTVNAVYWRV